MGASTGQNPTANGTVSIVAPERVVLRTIGKPTLSEHRCVAFLTITLHWCEVVYRGLGEFQAPCEILTTLNRNVPNQCKTGRIRWWIRMPKLICGPSIVIRHGYIMYGRAGRADLR